MEGGRKGKESMKGEETRGEKDCGRGRAMERGQNGGGVRKRGELSKGDRAGDEFGWKVCKKKVVWKGERAWKPAYLYFTLVQAS
jgi:hypothetical protein